MSSTASGSVTTESNTRSPSMTMQRLPLLWSNLFTAFLLLLTDLQCVSTLANANG